MLSSHHLIVFLKGVVVHSLKKVFLIFWNCVCGSVDGGIFSYRFQIFLALDFSCLVHLVVKSNRLSISLFACTTCSSRQYKMDAI